MGEDHAAADPVVKCPCCQLELNFGRDAKLFDEHYRDELYKNRSSRKVDSRRLISREYDFPKTFSLTENQFSGKTYFYTIGSRACKREKKKLENDGKSYLVPQMCPQCGKTLCSKQSLDNHLKVGQFILILCFVVIVSLMCFGLIFYKFERRLRGHPYMMSTKFWDFLPPPPLVRIWD